MPSNYAFVCVIEKYFLKEIFIILLHIGNAMSKKTKRNIILGGKSKQNFRMLSSYGVQ